MALTSGIKLGPYEIVSSAGAGGMGEVYRARDARLNREVAIKVLPAGFARDPERLRRFQQEAQAAAALNHPNILAVHDFGEHEGSPYMVTEFLEGETLRERLRPGTLPVRKATEYAEQVARGLAAAHEKGIVHRDLKPENIFVTRDGRVKILDFGLAKLTRPEGAVPSDAATLASQTEPGVVMGTVGYMSPEQVKGQNADYRSDLFSFGAILYEMLSGKRAFHGDTSVETMSAILKQDPPELRETNRTVPPALERIVRHCLEKNPDERFRSAHDVGFALENVSHVSQSSVALQAARQGTWLSSLKPVLIVLAIAFVGAGAFLAWRGMRPNSLPTFHRLTFERGMVLSARFAADGRSVIYGASWESKPVRIFSTPIDSPQARPLEIESGSLLGISRSEDMALAIGGTITNHLVIRDATLATAPLAGGAPREILEHVRAADWGPDGTPAVVHYVNGRSRIEYPIGKVLFETGGWLSHMRVSPKGDRIAFLLHPSWPDDRGYVALVDLTGNEKNLTGEWEGEEGLAWSPQGDEVWFTATSAGADRALYAVNTAGRLRAMLRIPGGLTLHDVATDGRVLLSFDDERVGMRGGHDGSDRDLTWLGWTIAESISPDGKWVVFSEESEPAGSSYIVGMRSFDGSTPKRLGQGNALGFSPDGKWVAATSADRSPHITLLPTGPGQVNTITVSNLEFVSRASVFPDGKHLLISGAEHGHAYRTYALDVSGGNAMPITPEGVESLVLSNDGNDLAARDLSGTVSIYPLQGGPVRTVPNTKGMVPLSWSADGRHLLTTIPDELPARILRVDRTSGKQELVRKLVPTDSGVYIIWSVHVTPDGKTYAYSNRQTLSTLYIAEGLR
ncbi:MAG TPA: WD40 repeat domain-containing serine/threonine protein kinase [Terriglobales bacterium]